VAARTGMSQADAEKRVNDVIAEAKTAADNGRKGAAKLSLWLTAAMLFGAFAASLAAVEGGSPRDNLRALSAQFATPVKMPHRSKPTRRTAGKTHSGKGNFFWTSWFFVRNNRIQPGDFQMESDLHVINQSSSRVFRGNLSAIKLGKNAVREGSSSHATRLQRSFCVALYHLSPISCRPLNSAYAL
jgi:hypothetical protein